MAVRRYVSIAGVAGVLGALVLLTQPAHVAEFWSSAVAHARIPDPPSVPCGKQVWYNADRECLSWTAPRIEGLSIQGLAPVASAPLLSR
jgi:hypothetical protein